MQVNLLTFVVVINMCIISVNFSVFLHVIHQIYIDITEKQCFMWVPSVGISGEVKLQGQIQISTI